MTRWIRSTALLLAFLTTLSTVAFALIGPQRAVLLAGQIIFKPIIPNFTLNGGLPKWNTCRSKVIANTANCIVLALGESTPRGLGAMFNSASNDAASGAWPAQVAIQLKQIWGFNAQSNSIAGSGNIGAMAAVTAYDTRVTTAGTWTVNSAGSCFATGNLTPGGCAFVSADTTSAFQANPKNTTTYPSAPTVPTDTLDVYSVNVNLSSVFGALIVNVNGGSTLATIAQNGAGATTYTKTTVSTGSAAADNTWNLKCSVTSSCLFDGLVFRNSTVSEASFIDMGMSGARVVDWVTTGNVYNPINSIPGVYKPDLCLIQDQGNDQDLGTPIATYKADLHTMIATMCQPTGDVFIVTSQPGKALATLGSPANNSTLTCTSGTVTVTTSSPHGLTIGNVVWITIAGVTPSGYNGSFQSTITGASTFTYAIACPGTETVPGTWVGLIPPYDTQATYAAAAVAQAAADGVPVLDWFTTMCGTISGSGLSSTCSRGGWTAGVANGWNGSFNGGAQDNVHQGPYAYGVLAAQIATILAN